jgi:hypothetical protein
MLKKKIWASFQRIIELFTQTLSPSLKNMGLASGIGDRGSGKKLIRIPDPGLGVKKAPDDGSGSATLLMFPNLLTL